jgi:hemerythrin-like metal-binding protein
MDLKLNIEEIDKMHDEFLILLDEAKASKDYVTSLEKLIEHTKGHFEYEELLMSEKNYYGMSEHKEEHKKLLGEMEYFCEKAKKGFKPFAKAYINEYAFDKFKTHIMNIDSQLAMFLKQN